MPGGRGSGPLALIFALTAASVFWLRPSLRGTLSYWAATVITSLVGCVPGGVLLVGWLWGRSCLGLLWSTGSGWLWGGSCLGSSTLNRFCLALCFLWLSLHLLLLHRERASNPVGFRGSSSSLPSFPWRDLAGWAGVLSVGLVASPYFPSLRAPRELASGGSPSTSRHTTPDWYFDPLPLPGALPLIGTLIPYAVLRSVPHRESGALTLVAVVVRPLLLFSP